MRYYNGCGNSFDGGIWSFKETTKSYTIECQERNDSIAPDKMIIKKDGKAGRNRVSKHKLIDWEDGTYTIYPFRQGVPCVFEPTIT